MSKTNWPVVPGSYIVGDPNAPVAVCTLTTERLMSPLASLPGVAIAGMVYTANLGITRIVMNITANPAIRYLLVCGRDSNLFHPGQSLAALADRGIDEQKRIIGATGYDPVLTTLTTDQVKQFREQVELVDWTSEEDFDALKKKIDDLSARNPGPYKTNAAAEVSRFSEKFEEIRPGGQREPLIYDPKGYFVISIEPEKGEIVLRHYLPDHTPAHEMRGRGASSMSLGLLRDRLVTQLSHAAYLGEELAKAQTALQFGLRYDQDRPLRPAQPQPQSPADTTSTPPQKMPPTPPPLPMTLEQFEASSPGTKVDIVLSIDKIPRDNQLEGRFLKMNETELFTAYHLSDHKVQVQWTGGTKMIMGEANEIVQGGRIRIGGELQPNRSVTARRIIILTKVTKIVS